MSSSTVTDQFRAGAPSPGSLSQPSIDIAVYHQLDAIEPEWRQFEQGADCTAFQTFSWLDAWCRHVGPFTGAQPAVAVGRQNGIMLFIVPLAVTPGTVRRLSFLGSELCDYNGPLLAPEFSARVTAEGFRTLWRRIGDLLQSDPRTCYDLAELTKMPERIGAQANPFMALPVDLHPSNAYVADLFGTWTEFYEQKRSSATRRRDRTKLKKLGEYGEVRFITPQDASDVTRSIDMLIEQKSRSFARMGVANIFDRPGWRAFFAAVSASERSGGLVHVSRLDVGATWSAINLGLVFRDTYYHVLASHDDSEAARLGPGVVHLRELLRYSIERGLKHFDFTIGDERYKREWSDRTLSLYDHVAASSIRGWPAASMVHAHRCAKRFIKQNETLWSLFSRARAALGPKPATTAEGGATVTVQKSPPIAPE